jgi:hypothetical protein
VISGTSGLHKLSANGKIPGSGPSKTDRGGVAHGVIHRSRGRIARRLAGSAPVELFNSFGSRSEGKNAANIGYERCIGGTNQPDMGWIPVAVELTCRLIKLTTSP